MTDRPRHIRHIDVSGDFQGLERPPDEGSVLVVLWWRDLPIGERIYHYDELPVPPAAVRFVALEYAAEVLYDRMLVPDFLNQVSIADIDSLSRTPDEGCGAALNPLDAALSILEESARQILRRHRTSVIVCTRERPVDLRRCISSLLAMEETPGEILIVDNAPISRKTEGVAREAASSDPRVRYVREDTPGLSVARNAGIRAASGDLLFFTDDDVEVHPKWLVRMCEGFDREDYVAVTGLILPAELETEAQRLFQWNHEGNSWGYSPLTFDTSFFKRTRSKGSPVWYIGAGASMGFRRSVFEDLGGFDERLGAGAAGCSEDSELWYRILVSGRSIRYEPAAVVFHTHRRTMAELERQMHDYMQGHVAALLVQYANERHFGELYRLFIELPRYYAMSGLRRLMGRSAPALLAPQVRGMIRGFPYYVRNRSARGAPSLK